MAKRLIETRRRRGKTFAGGGRGPRKRNDPAVSAKDVLNVYQREVDRKRILTRKADVTSTKLLFIVEALRRLFKEDAFNNLLRAENLASLPKPIADLMEKRGAHHA